MTEEKTIQDQMIESAKAIALHNVPTPAQVWLSIFCAAINREHGNDLYATAVADSGVLKYTARFLK
jgi:ribosomal protein L16/L10AE